MSSDSPISRHIFIKKSRDGFGFNIRGQTIEGGQVKAIYGKLYAPLQQVSAVTRESSADQAGLKIGDKILQVNGIDVEGASHKQVVDLIQNSGDEIHLVVIVSSGDDKPSGILSVKSSRESSNDYSDRRSLAITVPDYSLLEVNGEKFYVFNIHVAGRHLCSRRYREFDILHQQLKQAFPDFSFNALPAKWPFKLSDQQLDARRRALERYLDKICSFRVIGDSKLVQDFLSADIYDRHSVSIDVEIKIMLPDRSTSTFKINRFSPADKVYETIAEKIDLPKECRRYFFLFETVEFTFERKLRPNEYPHQIYVQNSSTPHSTCLSLRKFVFSPTVEEQLLKYPLTCHYLYKDAVDQLSRSESVMNNNQTLNDVEYIKYAQTLTDIYNTIKFPLCPCSSRKDKGSVIVSVNSIRLRLHACSDDGKLDDNQIANFDWTTVERYYVREEDFIFEYKRSTMKQPKAISLQTVYGQYMYDCFDCIFRELGLTNKVIIEAQ